MRVHYKVGVGAGKAFAGFLLHVKEVNLCPLHMATAHRSALSGALCTRAMCPHLY